jgi:hypothetical protein
MTGTGEVAQRLTLETRGRPVVRPAGKVGRRHWAQVDRAFAVRMATLVQSAPPYSALYGLARIGVVGGDWAHRQAGRYPTHIRLGAAERQRALDLRPTFTGWMDVAGAHGMDAYVAADGSAQYARFAYSMAEPALGDLFDRMRAYFATHAPFGQVGAEKGLARLCWLLAMFAYVFRNDPIDQPFYGLFRERVPTVEELHAAADEAVVTELVELVRCLHTSGGLEEMRRLAGHPPPGRPWGIAWPVFGAHWDDNDILVGGPDGATLVDVTSVLKVNDARRSRRWIWRLVGCAWLDTADAYRIRNVAVYLARYGVLVAWPLADLVEELLGGEDPERARREFLDLVARLRSTAPAVSP